MPSIEELAAIADAVAFIFTGSVLRAADTPHHPERHAVVIAVRDVIKRPEGMRGIAGREVTVELRQKLSEEQEREQHVFFADPVAIGIGIRVRERAHMRAEGRDEIEAALARAYAVRMAPWFGAVVMVVLGTTGPVRPLRPPAERRGGVPWALCPLAIERVLKGRTSQKQVMLIGPSPASKHLPRAPALREGIRAIFLLQRAPDEAMELVAGGERQAARFVAETSDIQPPERADEIGEILGATNRE
jgi:hypothetical protein